MNIQTNKLLQMTLKAVEDKKAGNVVCLDLRNVSPISDYFVICHGNSDVQVQAIATEVRKVVHEAGGVIRGIEGMNSGRWVLMDLGDVVVHIFHRDEREYYNIERLWSDAKVVETV
ncbi:ribosome silencing factor [Paenibacillus sp. 19GGS1-52]|uniref:Ribosomal silencing factor RsfS n=1 Tax=Paenibacillus monticola TaxID=2666075 RepID=A0A7X2L000_9BACL|nr:MULTISPECIES: ribosome silencing factor [Paenibacillus]MRN52252.1 ribosome silencing factor [Paenibacillus monticola]ULO06142.1 ribosome silencing factor [Paenibacillus sp. 19GGS1-52]